MIKFKDTKVGYTFQLLFTEFIVAYYIVEEIFKCPLCTLPIHSAKSYIPGKELHSEGLGHNHNQ
ncbi:MAG TPA: hypothetical protein DER05_11570 [Lutibacter sp.]|nr:hypothetical protein [Lutibacter sp.]